MIAHNIFEVITFLCKIQNHSKKLLNYVGISKIWRKNHYTSKFKIQIWRKNHSWAKFKIVLVRKPGRKFYYFMTKFQGSCFSFQSLNQNIKVVVFPSNFWNTTIIWQFFRMILNFAQECYYLENKVGVVDFTKAPSLIFGRSVNPIPTGEGRLSPSITTGTRKVFHLPASEKF